MIKNKAIIYCIKLYVLPSGLIVYPSVCCTRFDKVRAIATKTNTSIN